MLDKASRAYCGEGIYGMELMCSVMVDEQPA